MYLLIIALTSFKVSISTTHANNSVSIILCLQCTTRTRILKILDFKNMQGIGILRDEIEVGLRFFGFKLYGTFIFLFKT